MPNTELNLDAVVARVERDYESDPNERVAPVWTVQQLIDHSEFCSTTDELGDKVRFRLLDDDKNVYYGGWLLNDPHCYVQMIVLEWGKYFAGCTEIQVKVDDHWKVDIG